MILAGVALMGYNLAQGQPALTRDSLCTLAVHYNKQLLMAEEQMDAAHYERKAAKTNFLPKLSAMGTYMYNQKEVSLLSGRQKEELKSIGSRLAGTLYERLGDLTGQNTLLDKLIQPLVSVGIASPLDALGLSLTEALKTDTRNIWAGGVSLTQPVYMGGKIRAYYKITRYAEQLAYTLWEALRQDVIQEVDATYWLVVSLSKREELAGDFVELVQNLENDVRKMADAGIATRADELAVRVKVNEAKMALTQASNGLNMSRMLLCQLCGLPSDTTLRVADEMTDSIALDPSDAIGQADIQTTNRPELKSLATLLEITRQQVNITRAAYLPTIALTGNYLASNPSCFNGFEHKLRGSWNVGVQVSIPLFQWGEGTYKVKKSRTEVNTANLRLQEAREMTELQVHQCTYQLDEAYKRVALAESNLPKAGENLRYAQLGFAEGVTTYTQVMEAQTAWLAAQVSLIDAQISVKLAESELRRALGTLE